MTVDVRAELRSAFCLTDGGEGGLLEATNEALAACAHENLSDRALARLEEDLVDEVQSIRGREARDPLGLVLTPTEVAGSLVDLIEEVFPGTLERTSTVVDPAAGTGRLLDAWGQRADAERVGWDIDPVVLGAGIALSRLRARSDRRGGLSLLEVDGLAEPRPATDGAITVLSNPPFVASFSRRSQAASMNVAELRRLARGWTSGRVNTAVAFVARGVRDLLHPGEVAGFVLPDAILSAPQYAPTRRSWLSLVDRFHVGRLDERAFPRHGVRTVLVVCRRREVSAFDDLAQPSVECVTFSTRSDAGWVNDGELSVEALGASEALVIPWPTAASELAFGLRQAGHRLDESFSISDGVNPGPSAARARLLSEHPGALSRPRPLVEGRDISAFGLARPQRWIETDVSQILTDWRRRGTSLRRPELFEGPRLYSRQTSDRLVFAYADDDSLALNSVHVTQWTGDAVDARTELRRLAAVLNTPIVTEVYQALFAEDRRLFPQVKIRNLRALPIPWPAPADVIEAADRWSDAPSEPRMRHVAELVTRWLGEVSLANAAED